MIPTIFTDLEEAPDLAAQEAINTIHDHKLKLLLIALRQQLNYQSRQDAKDSGCG